LGIYRLEFEKTTEGRYISHLELLRAWERALRRAEIPIAFSEGFNPHPKMSFASALAVGVTSEQEYMEIEVKEELSAEDLHTRLNDQLPKALVVKRVVKLTEKQPALMAVIKAATYLIRFELLEPYTLDELQSKLDEFLAKESLIIQKESKKGKYPKQKDKELRSGIIALKLLEVVKNEAMIELTVQSGSEGNIRPEEVLLALKEIMALNIDVELANIHRKGLYTVKDGNLEIPLS
jgi:radical SAM-linked protein